MNYTNDEANNFIRRHVHKERHRKVLTFSLIDGLSYKAIADETGYSERHIGTLVRKYKALFAEKLEAERNQNQPGGA